MLQEQLGIAKGRLTEALSNMTNRQTHEMLSLQKQQEDFDQLLRASLADRDERHKEALQLSIDHAESEKKRLLASWEKERLRWDSERAQREKLALLDVQKQENVWKDRHAKELGLVEEKHQVAQCLNLFSSPPSPSYPITNLSQPQYPLSPPPPPPIILSTPFLITPLSSPPSHPPRRP